MKKTTLLTLIFLLIFIGCSKKPLESESDAALQLSEISEVKDKYLAYEHYFSIDTKEENLPLVYKNTIKACNELGGEKCILLDSSISKGKYPSAHIKIRVSPSKINQIMKTASVNGKITRESTHVEDLAEPFIDNKKRLSMLEEHRERLMNLQEKAANDIDALIKVSSELAKVQSDLEYTLGQKAFLLKRIEFDVVTINFNVDLYRSFWSPIRISANDFLGNLSDGISGTITALAYIFPGLVLLSILYLLFKFFRKVRGKIKA